MHAVTSLMRVQQLVIGRLDALLKPLGLTFARYEALVLLTFSSRGSAAAGQDGRAAAGAPTSVTSIVDRLEAAGLVVRRPHPERRPGRARRDQRPGPRLSNGPPAEWSGADFGLGASTSVACASSPPAATRRGRVPATSRPGRATPRPAGASAATSLSACGRWTCSSDRRSVASPLEAHTCRNDSAGPRDGDISPDSPFPADLEPVIEQCRAAGTWSLSDSYEHGSRHGC